MPRPQPTVRRAATLAAGAALALLAGCGRGDSGDPPKPGPDTTPPARVTDLYVRATTDVSATLTWTAPGDDGTAGTAAQYEIRYATAPLGAASWATAAAVTPPAPAAGGTRETLVVTGLTTGTTYWFALRAADEAANWSPLSDAPSARAVAMGLRTWRVKVDGTGDAPTLQAAIDSAGPGDLVLVADGVYTWTNQGMATNPARTFGMMAFFNDKHDFTVRSESGPAATIIDCQSRGRGVCFQGNSLNTTNITLEGFTVRNGRANAQTLYAGGGLFAHLCACTIRDCVFTQCVAFGPASNDTVGAGGGIWYGGVSEPIFERCVFDGNRASNGGGAYVVNSPGAAVFRDCVFTGNRAERLSDGTRGNGAGFYAVNFRFTMENCLLVDNRAEGKGGGLRTFLFDPGHGHDSTARNCTFVANFATAGGNVYADTVTTLAVENCIVALAPAGFGFARHATASLTVSCTDTWGNAGSNALPAGTTDGGGNFSLDPLFCATGSGADYHLQALSPCAPGNQPGGGACGQIGALPVGCGAR